MIATLSVVALALAAAPADAPPADAGGRAAILSAMTAELGRSSERLRLQGYDAPYYVAYQVAPSILVGELELQRVARANERGPILPSPWGEPPAPAAAESVR